MSISSSCATRSISVNPGRCSSQSEKVRIGIWCFKSVPGFVFDLPLIVSSAPSPVTGLSLPH
jgi:hypothetical protein